MTSTILGIAHFKFHPGKLQQFETLSARCRDIVAAHDTGTLRYDVSFNEDRSEAIVVEEYESEQALLEHADHIGEELSAAVIATGDVHGQILGEVSEELRAQLRGGPVTHFQPSDLGTT